MSERIHLDDLARLSPTKLKRALFRLSERSAEELLHDWRFRARDPQVAPAGDWRTWVFLGGRGAGKTRGGAEWTRERVRDGFRRIGLIAPTAGDARDVVVEGESGLLSVCWEGDRDRDGHEMGRPLYEPSKRRVTWKNGSMAVLYSADEPDRLRGPQHDTLWCDELAAWRFARETWDMAMFGLRIGRDPRVMVTTTPKPLSVLREILNAGSTTVTMSTTYDNVANLADAFVDTIVSKYEGTRLGRQELYAELLSEAEGALWNRALLERLSAEVDGDLGRIVVAVDPAITAKSDSNETGIIVAGRYRGRFGGGHVLADVSGRLSPGEWGRRVVDVYRNFEADRVVAEKNQGGDMVRHTIHTVDPDVPVRLVSASRGKAARAEPVAALYEQGRVRHVPGLTELEDQMVTWEPLSGAESPDRLDAVVWALTDLFLTGPQSRSIGAAPEVLT